VTLLEHWFTWGSLYYLSEWLIRLIMLVVVPFRRSPDAAKGWLLLIFILPWPGLIIYLVIGRPKWSARRRAKLEQFQPAMKHIIQRLRSSPTVFHPRLGPDLDQAVTLARNLGQLPILGGNSAELLADYQGAIDRLIADIDAARDHVHLLYYIIADDRTGHAILDALARAVKRGVRCRILMDALGTGSHAKRLLPKLKQANVAAHVMLPVRFLRPLRRRADLRNHRKIAVIDGHMGYIGSQNLVDSTFKKGITYEEMVARVTGPIVLELQFLFVRDWFLESDEILNADSLFPDPQVAGSIPAQALPSSPGYLHENNQRVFVALVHSARSRVVITTPYFIPDDALLQALETAVLRGVEVHLVVSKAADQVLVSLAQKSYYDALLEAGLKIHLYQKHFLHAKHLSIDDDIAMVGSSNMDIRSFQLNAEIVLLFYDPAVVGQLRAVQERYFAHCELLTLEKWRQRSGVSEFLENMARLLSPLL
jgi:cardiolipin synthase A/B